MKKIKNALSWASFILIVFVVGVASMWAGACVVNYLADAMGIAGTWQSLLLSPVLLIVAFGTEVFLLLGLKRFGASN